MGVIPSITCNKNHTSHNFMQYIVNSMLQSCTAVYNHHHSF